MSDTHYTETEALLFAMRDGDSDELREYLRGNMLRNELYTLSRAASDLARAAREVANRMPYAGDGSSG